MRVAASSGNGQDHALHWVECSCHRWLLLPSFLAELAQLTSWQTVLCCRSDSNGEDLEGYAGAGLYESITMDETQLVRVDYNDDPITKDPNFRRKVRHVVEHGVTRGCFGNGGQGAFAELLFTAQTGTIFRPTG
eukprot:GHRQ01017518.1.p2 GENE.GHRQ01017518.1~~GHRQ01017518.1.p2  ORF type:complete len:134 (+),score=25.17 GHRQ01017518.1:218-619(+)